MTWLLASIAEHGFSATAAYIQRKLGCIYRQLHTWTLEEEMKIVEQRNHQWPEEAGEGSTK